MPSPQSAPKMLTGIGDGVLTLSRRVTSSMVFAVGSGCPSTIVTTTRGRSPACSVASASIVAGGLDGCPPGQATGVLLPQLDGTWITIGFGPWCTSGMYDGGSGGS